MLITTLEEFNAILPKNDELSVHQRRIKVLQWLLKNRDMTLVELSKQANLHYQTLMKLLNGQRMGSSNTWIKILRVIQINEMEVSILTYPDLLQRLNEDCKKKDEDTKVYVYATEYNGFNFFYTYKYKKTTKDYSLELSLKQAKSLFEKQKPIHIIYS